MSIKQYCVMAVLTASSAGALAQAGYQCVIERLESAEVPSEKLRAYRERLYVGKQFSVDRASGRMLGALSNSYVTNPQVIDWGSKGNSYKVVTTLRLHEGAGRGSNVYVLTINEYVTGVEKPFVFLENDDVYFGKCLATP